MTAPVLNVSRRIRATPYTPRVESLGVSGYSVVNHTILPKGFRKSVQEDYWHLKQHVQIWDVGCQRQVEIVGPDAAALVQWMTPRDLSNAKIGQCLYAPIIDHNGGMINDPIILKLSDDRYWLSIADSDVLLWAKGLALGKAMDVNIFEPDVWPLAIQGPRSDDLMEKVFGFEVRNIGFFRFAEFDFQSEPLVIARSGYSKQGGFELYLDRPSLGSLLWDTLWKAGQAFEISPGSPNLIERVEGGLLSYGNEMVNSDNPLECGLGRYCQLDGTVDFIGRDALVGIAERGISRQIRGLIFDGESCPPCQYTWPVFDHDRGSDDISTTTPIGAVSTAIWSPRFRKNVSLAMINKTHWQPGTRVSVVLPGGDQRSAVVTSLPMGKQSEEDAQNL